MDSSDIDSGLYSSQSGQLQPRIVSKSVTFFPIKETIFCHHLLTQTCMILFRESIKNIIWRAGKYHQCCQSNSYWADWLIISNRRKKDFERLGLFIAESRGRFVLWGQSVKAHGSSFKHSIIIIVALEKNYGCKNTHDSSAKIQVPEWSIILDIMFAVNTCMFLHPLTAVFKLFKCIDFSKRN